MNVPNTAVMMIASRRLRIAATAAMLLCVVVGLALHQHQVSDAAQALRSIPAIGLVALLAALALHKVVHASMLAASVDHLSLGQSLVVTETYVGCSNSMIGGAAIGTGIKVAMLRAWNISGEAIAASITATAVIPGIALWAASFAATVASVVTGSAGLLQKAVCAISFIGVVGPMTFWALLLRQPRRVAWLARMADRALLVGLRLPMPSKMKHRLARMDVCSEAERLREAAAPFLGRRGAATLALALTAQVTISCVLLAALRSLGVGHEVTALEVCQCMAMARVLGSLTPVPGGLGLLDVGLLGGLVSAGAPRPAALAAIGVFRALTFVLPMITGPAALLLWRRTQRHSQFVAVPGGEVSVLPMPTPLPVITRAELPTAAVA